ncbi:hypothetical protein COUCH_11450 [Couchioplanes caeruleus]|uniref:hypothetical protein n=1 Tax=Couchioplanes caeruleus TaxID=56438 RepID=UPI0020C00014|nr:hypothetical protein [Couchioplanes caeruleus]UQU66838.1 hypothetical protein COUCH_11450 [Couchioplanes caeruleus]
MHVVRGRYAEARVYGWYVLALLRPGVEVPTFGQPEPFTADIERFTPDDLKIIVEEGRRQTDRQLADLEKNRARAATLLTIGLAELAVLAASAGRVFPLGVPVRVVWAISAVLVVLTIGGAASLLTSRADFGRLETRHLAAGPMPVLREAALGYAHAVGLGEETVRTRITVLRDGVLLAVMAALLYAVIWPVVTTAKTPGTAPRPSPTGENICRATCIPSSPSRPSPTTTATGDLAPTSATPIPS